MIKSNEHNWLKPPAQTRIPYYANSVTLTPDFPNVNGIVQSGTPYPANDETIQGFIVNDVDLSADLNATICTSGIVNIKQLPVELTEEAKKTLYDKGTIAMMSDGWFENVTPDTSAFDIIFQFLGTSFQIPCSGRKNNIAAAYDWIVSVDGTELGVFAGTSSDSSAGIAITGLENTTHTVTIKPNGDYTVGWGCAFGFWTGTSGANAIANKNKLTAVLNDPGFAHLYTETNAGSNYRIYQYQNCTSLTQIAPETMPDTVTTIGIRFCDSQYNYCTSLIQAADEYISSSVTYINDEFRYCQYQNCTSLIQAADEYLPDGLITIGSGLRMNQYQYCTKLTQTAEEIIPDSVTFIGSTFRINQYNYCSKLLIGSHVHSKHFATLLNKSSSNYQEMFHLGATVSTPDTMPRYYLEDGTTAPVTNLTPTSDKGYVYGRTGIAGYDELDPNWK
jgi:hypothetical protein